MGDTLAVVNRIIPFSSVDGPGCRTAIFLQGCNIDCKYCHNPETRGMCTGCGKCVELCPAGALSMAPGHRVRWDKTKCCECDTCIHSCPFDSSPRTFLMTPPEVYNEVRRQIPYIRGISVSGGECMLYPEFLRELFLLARADGLGTLIDSNGTIDFSLYPELLEVSDGVMLDIKAFNCEDSVRITGHDNVNVLKNARFLAERDLLYEVRMVIAPDLYDGAESVRSIGEFLSPYLSTHDIGAKIIAYRPMGVRPEYADMKVPDRAYLESLSKILSSYGFRRITII